MEKLEPIERKPNRLIENLKEFFIRDGVSNEIDLGIPKWQVQQMTNEEFRELVEKKRNERKEVYGEI